MRKTLLLSVVAAVAFLGLPNARATQAAGPGPGYIATDNVTWLANIPINTDSAGARIVGTKLYITEDRGLTIYDISAPELPKPLGFLPVPQQAYYTEEDVDTNGKILLIGQFGDLVNPAQTNKVSVIDVSNPSMPKEIGSVPGADAHTITCLLDCTWAYGSNGNVINITNPTAPTKSSVNWQAKVRATGASLGSGHDVTEVAPGLVVTSSKPFYYLDVHNPEDPKVLGVGQPPADQDLVHGNLWPQQGKDKWLLVGGETGTNCSGPTSDGFYVYDATKAQPKADGSKGSFTKVDEFHLDTGVPTDGDSPYDQFCAHWFTTHPKYKDGGLVAMGWYEHGTRFLDVNKDTGKITEKGWFYPVGGSTSAAYWVNDTILYSIDYQRGIDVLKFSGAASTKVVEHKGTTPAPRRPSVQRPATPFTGLSADGFEYRCKLA